MTRVIAALDDSATGAPILATALTLSRTFGGRVEAIHVVVDGYGLVRERAEATGVPLVELEGEVATELVTAASRNDVRALVIGARGTAAGARPAGRTALAVAERLEKPIVVVPPDSRHPGRLERILVPLEGTVPSSLALRRVLELATRACLEIVVLHVHDPASLPSFTDQPQHELETWGQEFVSRFCPAGVGEVRFEVRVGHADEVVPRVAEETDADLIALSWAQDLAADRAPVVRAVLTEARVPVMLIPVSFHGGGEMSGRSIPGATD
jgi:nucleotide-binding universal stress UspA family protein